MKRGIGKTESDYSNNANLVANNVANANPTNCINHVNNQLEQSYQNIPELYMKPKNQLNSQYDYDISEAYKVDPFQPDDDNLYKFMNYSMEDNSYLTINKTQDRSKSKENIVVVFFGLTVRTISYHVLIRSHGRVDVQPAFSRGRCEQVMSCLLLKSNIFTHSNCSACPVCRSNALRATFSQRGKKKHSSRKQRGSENHITIPT